MDVYYLLGIISVTIASFSQILLKKGAMTKHDSFIREYLNVCVITGYGMMFASVFLTMIVVRVKWVHFKYVCVIRLET